MSATTAPRMSLAMMGFAPVWDSDISTHCDPAPVGSSVRNRVISSDLPDSPGRRGRRGQQVAVTKPGLVSVGVVHTVTAPSRTGTVNR